MGQAQEAKPALHMKYPVRGWLLSFGGFLDFPASGLSYF